MDVEDIEIISSPKKLTLSEALSDLGWLPIAVTAFGGFGMLDLLKIGVLHDSSRLVVFFQAPLDAYRTIIGIVAAMIEPMADWVKKYINQQFDLKLTLDPNWRTLFAIGLIFPASAFRVFFIPPIRPSDFILVGIFILTTLFGSLFSGLIPSGLGWQFEGLKAAVPFAFFVTILNLVISFSNQNLTRPSIFNLLKNSFWNFVASSLFIMMISWFFSLFTDTPLSSWGILFGVVLILGWGQLRDGLADGDRVTTRLGLTMLGGVICAALIVLADAGLKSHGFG